MVSGANGWIGGRLAARPVDHGVHVIGVSRAPDEARERRPEVVWIGVGDEIERAVRRTGAVVNLAQRAGGAPRQRRDPGDHPFVVARAGPGRSPCCRAGAGAGPRRGERHAPPARCCRPWKTRGGLGAAAVVVALADVQARLSAHSATRWTWPSGRSEPPTHRTASSSTTGASTRPSVSTGGRCAWPRPPNAPTRASWPRGEPLARRAVALRRKILGPEHPDVAADQVALAGLLDAVGKTADEGAVNLNNLAAIHQRRGEPQLAEPLYRRALSIKQRALGDRHPELATTLNNLATLLRKAGRHREAEPLYLRALALLEAAVEPSHPSIARDRSRVKRAPPERQPRFAVKLTGKSGLHSPVADGGLRTVPEAFPADVTVIVTLRVPTFGSL